MRHVQLHPAAVAEATLAYDWYSERSPGAAKSFLAELDRAIEAISDSPERYPLLGDGFRRYLLGHFPFYLAYKIEPDRVLVLAVAHGRRKPGYWRNR